MALASMTVILPCTCSPKEDSTRTRASTLRSAAILYYAQNPAGRCPTVEQLLAEGYLQVGTDVTDGFGHTFWIECDRGDIDVRSCRFDGENVLEAR